MNDKSKKIFLLESDVHIKLIPDRMCKYDTPVMMGWRGNEPVLSEVSFEEEGIVVGIESMEGSLFLTPDVEQEPIHHSNMMKGNGKRKLVNKNGYTYPKPKGRWS